MSGIEDVLAEHADCALNAGQDLGSMATGRDVWSCGITLPFADDLEDAERAHVAAAIREWLLSDEVVERAARAHYGGTLGVTLGMESDEFRADRLNDMRAALRAAMEADA